MSQIVVHVAADADDGRDDGTNWVTSQIQIGFSSIARHSGIRFTGITIPSGSTIDSAKLTVFENNFDNGGSLTVTIGAWKTNNPAVFDGTHLPHSVAQTTATVPWTFNATTNVSTTFDSPDIKTIIQELLDAYGMSSSSIGITITGSGSGGDAYFEDYSAAGTAEAILTINYTAGAAFTIVGRTVLDYGGD